MTTIFVFGSNMAGRHGRGSAWEAKRFHGAIQGQGEGLQGRSYAIPTKDRSLHVLLLSTIAIHVATFIEFACAHPEMRFQIVPIGCGLAGYRPTDIAPFFMNAPNNCQLPQEFIGIGAIER